MASMINCFALNKFVILGSLILLVILLESGRVITARLQQEDNRRIFRRGPRRNSWLNLTVLAEPSPSSPSGGQSFVVDPIDQYCKQFASTCSFLSNPASNPLRYHQENNNNTLDVGLVFSTFLDIREVDETFSIQGRLLVSWQISKCNDYNREGSAISQQGEPLICYYDKAQMWRPDLVHINGLGYYDNNPFNRAGSGGERIAVIIEKRRAVWQIRGQFDSRCKLSFTRFPYDTQECTIEIGWAQFWDGVEFQFGTGDVVFGDNAFSDSDIWDLVDYSSEVVNIINNATSNDGGIDNLADDANDANGGSKVIFSFSFERKSRCYAGAIFVPMVLLMAIQTCVFAIPAEIGDRPLVSTIVFLSSAVLLLDTLPRTHFPTTPEPLYIMIAFAAQTSLGTLVTIYTFITCRLASDPDNVVNAALNFTEMRLIDFIDLIAAIITFLGYLTITLTLFLMMLY